METCGPESVYPSLRERAQHCEALTGMGRLLPRVSSSLWCPIYKETFAEIQICTELQGKGDYEPGDGRHQIRSGESLTEVKGQLESTRPRTLETRKGRHILFLHKNTTFCLQNGRRAIHLRQLACKP